MTGSRDGPLLADALLRELELLRVADLGVILGGLAGERAGPRPSQFAEFADYRGYQPGDDPRLIDWNAYARLGELHVRTSFAQQRLLLTLLVDCSGSMSGVLPYAKQVAAALGAVALLHSDAVRVCPLANGQAWPTPTFTGPGGIRGLLDGLARLRADGGTALAEGIRLARQGTDEWGVPVLVSDLLIPRGQDGALDWLGRCGTVLHLTEPGDDRLLAPAAAELRDSETGEVVNVTITRRTRQRYRALARQRCAELAARCAASGLRYLRPAVSMPVRDLLFGQLGGGGALDGDTRPAG